MGFSVFTVAVIRGFSVVFKLTMLDAFSSDIISGRSLSISVAWLKLLACVTQLGGIRF